MNTVKLYDKNYFVSSLPTKPYCSNDLSYGLVIRRKEKALECRYIQVNHLMINCLVFDLDYENAHYAYEAKNLPPPNIITSNPTNGRCHYIYFLKMPVCKTDNARLKPLKLLAAIQYAYTLALGADSNYVGLVTKNPLHDDWKTTWNLGNAYELWELAEYVDLPKRITKKTAIGLGRNVYLFDTIRKWSYSQVLFYKKHGASCEDFYNVVLQKLEDLNQFECGNLNFNEIKNIAKSISKWTWRNFSEEEFSKIQSGRAKQLHEKKKTENKEKMKQLIMEIFNVNNL